MADDQTPLPVPAAEWPAFTVERLTRQAERANAVTQDDLDTGLIARVLDNDERFEVVDLEHLRDSPHLPRGAATIWEPADFVSYVNRLGSDSTTLWADPDAASITAVFDDHTTSHDAGWRRHRATLAIRRDPEWAVWCAGSGQLGSQNDFAEFMEDHHAAVTDPDSATMLEVASTFQARRNSSFERGVRLTSGDVQLRWTDNTTASAGSKGHLEVPEKFTITLPPFLGVDPVPVTARLRYRISDGNLRIGYVLHRPDLAESEAFDRIRALVIEGVTAQMHLGPAPGPIKASTGASPNRADVARAAEINVRSSSHSHRF